MRAELQSILDALLANSEATKELSLDDVGAALGVLRVDTAEIDAMLEAIESAGRKLIFPTGATGVTSLRAVLQATRALKKSLSRKPTVEEIAQKSALSVIDVRRALLLAQVMGRGAR